MAGWGDGVDAPRRHRCAKMVVLNQRSEREASVDEVTTIGLDIAKQVFHAHGADASGAMVFSRKDHAAEAARRSSPRSRAASWRWRRAEARIIGGAS